MMMMMMTDIAESSLDDQLMVSILQKKNFYFYQRKFIHLRIELCPPNVVGATD
jgi:hypothetical protein